MDNYKSELVELLKTILDCDEIDEDSKLGDPSQWDSLKHMKVIIGLEEHFNIKIQPQLITELISVKKINEYLITNI